MTRHCPSAASWCILTRLCQQTGRPRLHDRERNREGQSDLLDEVPLADVDVFKVLDLPGIKSHQWSIVSCSAVTGNNLLEGLNWVVGEVASRLYYSTLSGGASLPLPGKLPIV